MKAEQPNVLQGVNVTSPVTNCCSSPAMACYLKTEVVSSFETTAALIPSTPSQPRFSSLVCSILLYFRDL
ncbi:hypothetical protein V2G26_019600 [Clonostachys chloroleuca]